jgi:type VI secretion system secreted protein VgrG
MPASQTGRFLKVNTPLGADAFLLRSFSGGEGMSRLFRFRLDLLSEQNDVAFADLVGESVSFGVQLADGESYRWFNGIVSRFALTGDEGRYSVYQAEIVPKLWRLTRTADCRIFQQKTVPQIIEELFGEFGLTDYELSLNATYDTWDYCVQYRETAFNFISRLMEQEGIFYFFRHEERKHTLVLADGVSAYQDCPGQSTVQFDQGAGVAGSPDVVRRWRLEHELRPGKYALTDYNFQTPSTSLLVTTNSIVSEGDNDALEVFDYPGEFEERAGGETWVKARMEEEEAPHAVASGDGNVRAFAAGRRFTLAGHSRSDQNGQYLLTALEHSGTNGDLEAGGSTAVQGVYSNHFTAIKADVVFRPARVTPRPPVQGTQPAIVVGPADEEIYTDQYGRVKVQFYWDRLGENNENSSCWVRVSQLWAGEGWGAIHIPRIGQEVLVDFLEGDPDRPVIVGRVYNAEQMPPYTLPDNMTQSGIKSRSSKEAAAENFNELRFEDKKGEEQVYFHAEKNFDRVVENNDTLKVGFEKKDAGDQTVEVFNNQTITVGAGEGEAADGSQTVVVYKNRTETVKTGDETVTIDQGKRTHTVEGDETLTVRTGNRSVNVDTGNDTHTIAQGNREVKIDMGNDTLTISQGNHTVKIDMGKSETEAMQSIELKVGQNSVKIDQQGVTISALKVAITGQTQAEFGGLMTTVKADGILTVQGSLTKIN